MCSHSNYDVFVLSVTTAIIILLIWTLALIIEGIYSLWRPQLSLVRMSYDGLIQKKTLFDPRKHKLGKNKNEMGKGEKPINNVLLNKLLLWPPETQSHWEFLENYIKYTSKLSYQGTEKMGYLATDWYSHLLRVACWGMNSLEFLSCHVWVKQATITWKLSPHTKNQGDTDASDRKLSVTIGTALWEKSEVDGSVMGEYQQHPLQNPTKLSSYLISGSHEYQHSPVFSSLISWTSL